jgi:hypothetical protein
MEAQPQPDRQQQNVKRREQIIKALDLRAIGATYDQIAKAFDPPISRQRAFQIVKRGLQELNEKQQESAENLRRIELIRMKNLMRLMFKQQRKIPPF